MSDILYREFVYISYYFEIQFIQIFKYYLFGVIIGSIISVFFKKWIVKAVESTGRFSEGVIALFISSLLGIASPLCMYGTIPIVTSLSKSGVKEGPLAAFMMSSILLNPQLIIYSGALGSKVVAIRIISCFFCGIVAGLAVNLFKGNFFTFKEMEEKKNRDTHSNLFIRFMKNIGRNLKITGPYFLLGVFLSALFQRYIPGDFISSIFGKDGRLGILLAATMGVPLYACGGGTIPLISAWLTDGMSIGSAAAFMITGPATKITNLGALKIVLTIRNFFIYLSFIFIYALLVGIITNIIF